MRVCFSVVSAQVPICQLESGKRGGEGREGVEKKRGRSAYTIASILNKTLGLTNTHISFRKSIKEVFLCIQYLVPTSQQRPQPQNPPPQKPISRLVRWRRGLLLCFPANSHSFCQLELSLFRLGLRIGVGKDGRRRDKGGKGGEETHDTVRRVRRDPIARLDAQRLQCADRISHLLIQVCVGEFSEWWGWVRWCRFSYNTISAQGQRYYGDARC